MQHRLPQNAYPTSLYDAQAVGFQQAREVAQYPYQGHRWMDPYARNSLLQSHRTETKPRLSKGEVEQLEAEFQKNNKPSSNVKKGLAEQMRVDVARINNWFQNRRAKKKQELKAQLQDAKSKAGAPETQPASIYSGQASPHSNGSAFDSTGIDGSYFPSACHDFSSMMSVNDAAAANTVAASMPCTMAGAPESVGVFSYPYMVFPNGVEESPSFGASLNMKQDMGVMYHQDVGSSHNSVDAGFQDLESEQMDQQDFSIKSPPAIDLAGRRKRPGLALSGLRSISNGPATGMDFGNRRVDPSSPMRRVASATGFGPHGIRRFPAPQRGQYNDRRQESILQAARSPNAGMSSLTNAMAPPTPNTPVVATHQSLREATVSSNSASEPPATPITVGDAFTHSIETTLGFGAPDEALLTPGVEYPVRTTEFCLPNYVSDNYMSQPSTPSFPNKFPFIPHQNQRRQLQFNNFTAQDFSGSK
ncbi:unnamed protein product [Parascedosporium putredinis]|uniref:Homeobox domain-containing protein n=1 Tax=Parascedosporium putredinis TaxID=1442378 RepID=A0A9P1H6M6_9PEZI|nr:unnamed protein product [Parascedosporium putredinis]CAI7997686.1 unnamed protein product [Parascedosporium putredinis]